LTPTSEKRAVGDRRQGLGIALERVHDSQFGLISRLGFGSDRREAGQDNKVQRYLKSEVVKLIKELKI
jgi:hypothetical protein